MKLHKLLVLSLIPLLASCLPDFTDAATRIANDIEAGATRVGTDNGAKFTIEHHTPSKADECVDSYKVQIDKAGLIVIWCYDKSGVNTVSSHSTSYHARFVDTPNTYILDKKAGETLRIDLERQDGRVIIANVN
jgi:hypothetical protein